MQDGRALNEMRKVQEISEDFVAYLAGPIEVIEEQQTVEDDDCEGAEYLGDFASVDDYFREQLAQLLAPAYRFLVDGLDMRETRRCREEDGRYRFFVREGRVYRTGS